MRLDDLPYIVGFPALFTVPVLMGAALEYDYGHTQHALGWLAAAGGWFLFLAAVIAAHIIMEDRA